MSTPALRPLSGGIFLVPLVYIFTMEQRQPGSSQSYAKPNLQAPCPLRLPSRSPLCGFSLPPPPPLLPFGAPSTLRIVPSTTTPAAHPLRCIRRPKHHQRSTCTRARIAEQCTAPVSCGGEPNASSRQLLEQNEAARHCTLIRFCYAICALAVLTA